MKNYKIIIMAFALISTLNISKTFAQTANEIAHKVYDRSTPKDGESDMSMTLINKKGRERVRELHQFFKDYGDIEKKVMFFKSPADVKNTSFMNWSYDSNKDDDQWLYLPALKKVKRISSSGKDNDFMGSDFTYADMEKRSPDKDHQKLLRTENYNGEACFVMEATPKEEEMYSKKIAWIAKDKWIPMKVEYYDEDGELLKILKMTKVQKIKGYWNITDQIMENVQKNHKTRIVLKNIKVDINLGDSKLSQRAMKKGL